MVSLQEFRRRCFKETKPWKPLMHVTFPHRVPVSFLALDSANLSKHLDLWFWAVSGSCACEGPLVSKLS